MKLSDNKLSFSFFFTYIIFFLYFLRIAYPELLNAENFESPEAFMKTVDDQVIIIMKESDSG